MRVWTSSNARFRRRIQLFSPGVIALLIFRRYDMDTKELKSKFGNESELTRLWLPHLECYGTQISATVTPDASEERTLQNSWDLVKDLAAWLLDKGTLRPDTERYEIIVGWSSSIRSRQGQIFKTGGSAVELLKIVAAPDYEYVITPDHSPLRHNWEKDVFAKRKDIGI